MSVHILTMVRNCVYLSLCGIPLIACQNQNVSGVQSHSSAVYKNISKLTPAKAYHVSSSNGLQSWIKSMERNHPALVAAEAEVGLWKARSVVDYALPNPSAQISTGQLSETAAGRVNAVIGIEQSIPHIAKRKKKRDKALKMAQLAEANRAAIKLSLAYELRISYWNYYKAYHQRRVLRESRSLLLQLKESMKTRVEANLSQASELVRLSTEIAKIEKEIILKGSVIVSEKANINRLMHRPSKASLPIPIYQQEGFNVRALDYVANHPDLRKATAREEAAKLQLDLAKLESKPDFKVGLGYGDVDSSGIAPSANGRDQVIVTFGVTIPLWKEKNSSIEQIAHAQVRSSQAQKLAVENLLSSELTASKAEIQAQRQLIKLFDHQIIPDSRTAYEFSTTSYATGKSNFSDLVDTWRMLLNYQLQQEQNKAALGKAIARLKRATNQQ